MKKFNMLALVVLVSVNVLTPISYAQENMEDSSYVVGDVVVNLLDEDTEEAEKSQLSGVVESEILDEKDNKVLTEESEEKSEERSEEQLKVTEDVMLSVINIVDTVNSYVEGLSQEVLEEMSDVSNSDAENNSNSDLSIDDEGQNLDVMLTCDKPIIERHITHDKEIIKLEIILDSNCDNKVSENDERRELRIKDKNEGAKKTLLSSEAFQLKQLMDSMCEVQQENFESLTVSAAYNSYLNYVCREGFTGAAEGLVGEEINSYDSGMEYILTHYNTGADTYGNYYRWGNTSGYVKYEEMSCKQNSTEFKAIAQNFSKNCDNLVVADDAKERGFMNMSDLANTGWFEGYYDNPCDASKGEYLPSPDDWRQLVSMWGDKGKTINENYEILNVAKFMQDFMVPNAGIISLISAGLEKDTKGLFEMEDGGLDNNLHYSSQPDYLWSSRGHSYNSPGGLGLYFDIDDYGAYWDLDSQSANPVRCFVVPEDQRVSVKLVDGTEEKTIITQKGKTIGEPEVNAEEGAFLVGWYDENGDKFDFINPINDDVELRAKWGKIEYNTGDIAYIDTNGKSFSGIGTITITYGDKSITMLDRNLGAKSSGAGCTNDAGGIKSSAGYTSSNCVSDYGYHFQWGNNYGFAIDEDPEIGTEYVDTSSNKWNNPYVSETFIKGDDNGRWDDSLNNGLWGGDNEENPDYMRQGPCPENYHIPSAEEWNKVLEFLAKIKGYDLHYEDGLAYYGENFWDLDREVMEEFTQILGIPNAGYCDYNGFPGGFDFDAEFWTSSPSDPSAVNLIIEGGGMRTTIGLNPAGRRDWADSVRCFADNYEEGEEPLVLSYDTRGGTPIQAQTIPEGENGYLPGYTTSRTGHTLLGWYDDYGKLLTGENNNTFTNLTMKDLSAENGVETIYARWDDDHVVTFKDYDGEVIKVVLVRNGGAITAPEELARNGYKFKGWYTDKSGGEERDFDNNVVNEDLELYAHWQKNQSSGGHSGGGGGNASGNSNGKDSDNTSSDANNQSSENDKSSVNEDGSNNGKTSDTENEEKKQNNGNSSNVSELILDMDAYNNKYSEEFNIAYQFAYKNNITTRRVIENADMTGKLTRIAMAKMLSQYAINVMGKTPDETRNNTFNDVSRKKNAEYDNGVTLAYQLGIMGINMPGNNFRPDDIVTRGEFVSALSRMLYKTSDGKYRATAEYYTNHIKKLKDMGILTKAEPKMVERRGYVMLMLWRSVNILL